MMNEKTPMELYIHIPFCERKCKYCDFLSMPANEETQKSYVNKLIEEIRMQSKNYQDYRLSSVYIGGGTPSILNGLWVFNIMSAVYESFAINADAEISIECNPGTVNSDKLTLYREAGINRISLGLQSTRDKELKLLGRIHTYEDFLKSYQYVRSAGFTNVNVDIMSSLPGQSLDDWKSTLKKIVMLKPEHISAYSLIIEKGTPFYDLYGIPEGRILLPDEETDMQINDYTRAYLKKHDYERYEISNYARQGMECRHNIGYWTGVEYLGVGLGASSFIMGHRFHSLNDLGQYMKVNLNEDLTPLYQDVQELTKADKMSEFMFLGLRMTQGVSGSEFIHRFGRNMFLIYEDVIDKYRRANLLEVDKPWLRLTEKGMDVSNTVMADFLL